MTVYAALWGNLYWQNTIEHLEPPYQEKIFIGGQGVPIFCWIAIPDNAHSTIIGTYGITGELPDQWYLKLLGRKAYAQGYAVVLFDWRAHGKTAQLSPALTSDGLFEGEDFVRIAAEALLMGCPAKFWFTGFSLGGQLALWGVKTASELINSGEIVGIKNTDIGGGAVICPNLDSVRSLPYFVKHPIGKYIEARIAVKLKQLAWRLHELHPGTIDPTAIEKVNSIKTFDQELVIGRLGFSSVDAYYQASSGLKILPNIDKPTLIIYACDDIFFDPNIIPDLQEICTSNPVVDLLLTRHGGHIGYLSSAQGKRQAQDPDPWWAWNRVLQWIGEKGE